MAKILILGGGFGALIAAEQLASSLNGEHEITLVSPNRNFIFFPALVHLAFGKCEADDVTFDLGHKMKEIGIRYVQGEMIAINRERRTVEVAGEDLRGEIAFDYLVIAIGRRLATEKVPGFFEYAQHLLGIGSALKLGRSIEEFGTGRIVVGLCQDGRLPVPVCETAFALAKKFKAEISDGRTQIKLIFPGSLDDAFGGAGLRKELQSAITSHGINVLYDIQIADISENYITSRDGHKIDHDLLILVPPFRGNAALSNLGITDDSHFIAVDEFMRVKTFEGVYAVGDIAALDGPKFAHMAVRQGKVAAENIVAELRGEEPDHKYQHEIATVIDTGGADSIYLHYGIWDQKLYRLGKGKFWSLSKHIHDAYWQMKHK